MALTNNCTGGGDEEKEAVALPERTTTELEMAAVSSPPHVVAGPLLLASSPDVPSLPLRSSHAVQRRR
jgi:hypothetical protein